jgi:hypothetical protein
MCSKLGACVVVVMDAVVETLKAQLARLCERLAEAWDAAAASGNKCLFRRTKSTWRLDHGGGGGVCAGPVGAGNYRGSVDGFGGPGTVTGLYITALVRK